MRAWWRSYFNFFPVMLFGVVDPAEGGGTATVEPEATEDVAAEGDQGAPERELSLEEILGGLDEDPIDAVEEATEEAEAEESADEAEEGEETEETEEETEAEEGEPTEAKAKGLYRDLKKTRQRAQEAEAKLSELQAQVAQVPQLQAALSQLQAAKVVPAPTAQDPLATVQTAEALQEVEAFAQQLKDWIDDNPEGGPCPLFPGRDGQPTEVDEVGLKNLRAKVRADLRAIPQRRDYLQRKAQTEAMLVKEMPELSDPNHEINLRVNQILASTPELKRLPEHRLGAFFYEIGRRVTGATGADVLRFVSELQNKPKPSKQAGAQQAPVKRVPVKPGEPVSPKRPPSLRRPAVVSGNQTRVPRALDTREQLVGALADILPE